MKMKKPKKSAYAQQLGRKIKAKREKENGTVLTVRPDAHPMRYPKHGDADKGQVVGGECNTTRCSNRHAHFFNAGTFGLYCSTCAHGINRGHPYTVCSVVETKPTIAEMDEMRSALDNAVAAARRAG